MTFDLSPLRPSAKVLDRNEHAEAPEGWDPWDGDVCLLCSRPLLHPAAFVECVDGGLNAHPRDGGPADHLAPGYLGIFPVGPGCARKIPTRYLKRTPRRPRRDPPGPQQELLVPQAGASFPPEGEKTMTDIATHNPAAARFLDASRPLLTLPDGQPILGLAKHLAALKALLLCAAAPGWPGLDQIEVEVHGSTVFLSSTNGHVLLTVQSTDPELEGLNRPGGGGDPFRFVLSAEGAKLFVSSKGHAEIQVEEGVSFPDVRPVIPFNYEDPSNCIGISAKYLLLLGNVLRHFKLTGSASQNTVTIQHNGAMSPVLVGAQVPSAGPAEGVSLVIMPMRMEPMRMD